MAVGPITVTLKCKMPPLYRLRMKAGALLIRMGASLVNCKIRIVVKEERRKWRRTGPGL